MLPPLSPHDALRRDAAVIILGIMAVASGLATFLHSLSTDTPIISRVIPPLTCLVFLSLLLYLLKKPTQLNRVIWLTMVWVVLITFVPAAIFFVQALGRVYL